MEKKNILLQLQNVFREVFENEEIVLSTDMKKKDVDGWNSLRHLQLIIAVEDTFDISINPKETLGWNTIDAIIEFISDKL